METQDNSQEQHQDPAQNKKKKGGIHNNALYAASMGRAATAQVDPHSNRGLAQTGTNISYEGPTAPGSGVGDGYSSGQSAAGSSISTSSDYDQARIGKKHDHSDSDESRPANPEADGNELP